MRRKDREMSEEFGIEVIDHAPYGVLSMFVDDELYSLPLSFVRDGMHLYIHSAKAGTKVEFFNSNPKVRIVFVVDVKVPELYTDDELEKMSMDASNFAQKVVSTVFTTEYASCIVEGELHLVEDRDEIFHGMRLICEKYTPSKMKYFDHAMEASLSRINVYRVDISNIRGKRKKFDADGKEMKWQREPHLD